MSRKKLQRRRSVVESLVCVRLTVLQLAIKRTEACKSFLGHLEHTGVPGDDVRYLALRREIWVHWETRLEDEIDDARRGLWSGS